MPDDIRPGVAILRAFRILSTLGHELSALREELDRLLVKSAEGTKLNFADCPHAEDADWPGEEWVCAAWLFSYTVSEKRKVRGRPARMGTLSYTIDVGREDGLPDLLGEAAIIVAWSPEDDPWTLDCFEVPIAESWSDEYGAGRYQIEQERLVISHEKGEGAGGSMRCSSWWYVVPLAAIGRREDIQKLLVDPVLDILTGEPANVVFSEGKAGKAVRFRFANDELRAVMAPALG